MKSQKGFTLVEISIVLVIVGLLLGGVLKGQELIEGARVRSLVNDINGIRAAWYGFQDRFHAIPGDFPNATLYLNSSFTDGDGNGKVDSKQEIASVWQFLSHSGFIAGEFDGSSDKVGSLTDTTCSSGTCPQNPYYGFYKISYSDQALGSTAKSNEFYTGENIPSSVLYEVDNKLDDGLPGSGQFRVHSDLSANCTQADKWIVDNPVKDCAAVYIE